MPLLSHDKRRVEPLPYVVLSTVKPEPVHWLWNPYIPRGGLTMIVGDGGYGKSYMTCKIAADLSAGRALPGQEAQDPQRILMINAEDGISQVMLPRIQAMNGNLENIAAIEEGFTLNKDVAERIYAAVEEFDAAIVFLDPMVVYLGGEVDFFKANEVRHVLDKLTEIARRKNIAIVGVHHVKKAMSPTAQHRSLGSVDFVNGVRSALLVDISKGGTYYMKHVKHNWSKAGTTQAYTFYDDNFAWLGEMHTTADMIDAEVCHVPRGKARAFIIASLKDGPVPSLEFIKRAKDEGFTQRTIERAKKGVAHSEEMVKEGVKRWYWVLNEDQMPRPETGEKPIIEAPSVKITNGLPQEVLDTALERLNGTRS